MSRDNFNGYGENIPQGYNGYQSPERIPQSYAPYGYTQNIPYGYEQKPLSPQETVDILELKSTVPTVPNVYKPLSAFLSFILAIVFSLPAVGLAVIIPCLVRSTNLNLKSLCKAYIGVNLLFTALTVLILVLTLI